MYFFNLFISTFIVAILLSSFPPFCNAQTANYLSSTNNLTDVFSTASINDSNTTIIVPIETNPTLFTTTSQTTTTVITKLPTKPITNSSTTTSTTIVITKTSNVISSTTTLPIICPSSCNCSKMALTCLNTSMSDFSKFINRKIPNIDDIKEIIVHCHNDVLDQKTFKSYSTLFQNFHQVEKISITECIPEIHNSALLKNLSSLRYIDLSHNYLQYLDPLGFGNHNFSNLTYLDYSFNNISKFNIMAFVSYPSLRILNISNNKLKTGSDDLSFAQNLNLVFLNVSNNPQLNFFSTVLKLNWEYLKTVDLTVTNTTFGDENVDAVTDLCHRNTDLKVILNDIACDPKSKNFYCTIKSLKCNNSVLTELLAVKCANSDQNVANFFQCSHHNNQHHSQSSATLGVIIIVIIVVFVLIALAFYKFKLCSRYKSWRAKIRYKGVDERTRLDESGVEMSEMEHL